MKTLKARDVAGKLFVDRVEKLPIFWASAIRVEEQDPDPAAPDGLQNIRAGKFADLTLPPAARVVIDHVHRVDVVIVAINVFQKPCKRIIAKQRMAVQVVAEAQWNITERRNLKRVPIKDYLSGGVWHLGLLHYSNVELFSCSQLRYEATDLSSARYSPIKILALAQLPPPIHGVTLMSCKVHSVLKEEPQCSVEQLWMGGASNLDDINRRSVRKALAFLRFLSTLGYWAIRGKRHDVAYVTLAPWSHAAIRDALLAMGAKFVARRTLVHLHGEGLDAVLGGTTLQSGLMRWLLKGCELITASPSAVEKAHESRIFAKASILNNTVPDPGPFERERRGELRVGYLANLDPRKGAIRFVEAIAAMREGGIPIEGVMGGAATPFLSEDALRNLIEERGLSGNIHVLGPLYGEAKDAFYKSIDLFLYPTKHDHAPLVVLEALSYAVVPIVYEQGAIAAMVSPEFAGNVIPAVLPPQTAIARTVVLARIYLDRDRLAQDQRLARLIFLERFNESQFARDLMRLIRGDPVEIGKFHRAPRSRQENGKPDS